MTTAPTQSTLRGLLALGLGAAPLTACHDDSPATTEAPATDGDDGTGSASDSNTPTEASSDSDTPTTDASSDTGDSGPEPPPPGDQTEACDAGDEAFVKRLIPLIQGRKPEGMREVLLLVRMIEQG